MKEVGVLTFFSAFNMLVTRVWNFLHVPYKNISRRFYVTRSVHYDQYSTIMNQLNVGVSQF